MADDSTANAEICFGGVREKGQRKANIAHEKLRIHF